MRLCSALALAVLLTAAACSPAPSEPPEEPGRPAPESADEVLREAMAALADLPRVAAVFAHRVTTAGGGGDLDFSGTAWIHPAPEGPGNMMRLEGQVRRPDGAAAGRVITHDGDTVMVLETDSDVLRSDSVVRAGTRLFTDATGSAFYTWLDAASLDNLMGYDKSLEAGVAVAGVLCDVVRFPLPNGGGYEMAFARDDRLLRRYAFRTQGDPPARDEETVFTDLRIGEAAGAGGPFVLDTAEHTVEPYGPGILQPGDPAPDFTVADEDGATFTLAEQRGRVVLVDFWATWCGPCKPAMAGLQALSEEYAGRPVTVVGLSWMDPGDPAAFMTEHGITYPTFEGDEVAVDYGVPVLGLPTLFIIGPDGRLVDYSIGYKGEATEAWLRRVVDDALASAG